MDSRLKRVSIFLCLAMIAVLALVVIYANGGFSKLFQGSGAEVQPAGSTATVQVSEGSKEGTSTLTEKEPGQVGDDLSAFLSDTTFFDPERNEFLENALDMSNRLSILTTSIEKDLRIQVIDYEGRLVKGEAFELEITDSLGEASIYKDIDKDGVVYAGSLKAGNYEVELLPLEGYKVPTNSTTVRVKDKVEYVAIADISLLIKTEADIDAMAEDTAVLEAESTADRTEMITLQFGGTRTKAGIDVSKYQGDIDWDKVAAAGVEFAIIRAGYRGSVTGAIVEDPYFVANIKGAIAAGLEVGVYFFTQAITETEAVEEASAVISMISEYDVRLPIYIDTEGAGGNGRADGLDVSTRTMVCEAFCRTIVNAGYNGGVYACRNWLYNYLDTSKLEKYEIWDAEYVSIPQYKGYYTMWQHSSKGTVDGIVGNVDLDIYYY